ncbi:D-alanyl-D-alanine carboxypeptidase (Penicillin-binding protein 5/6) OS=Streptomyces albaduncus OX=68172 GN=FHS32_000976 PE=4 SV=1 [Streptomyces griseoloalbus]
MAPSTTRRSNEPSYKETARLSRLGLRRGRHRSQPVPREPVPPKSVAGRHGRAPARPPARPGGPATGAGSQPVASAHTGGGADGMGVALGITGGVLVLLAGGAFLVNRRWPLPDLVRRRPRP